MQYERRGRAFTTLSLYKEVVQFTVYQDVREHPSRCIKNTFKRTYHRSKRRFLSQVFRPIQTCPHARANKCSLLVFPSSSTHNRHSLGLRHRISA